MKLLNEVNVFFLCALWYSLVKIGILDDIMTLINSITKVRTERTRKYLKNNCRLDLQYFLSIAPCDLFHRIYYYLKLFLSLYVSNTSSLRQG